MVIIASGPRHGTITRDGVMLVYRATKEASMLTAAAEAAEIATERDRAIRFVFGDTAVDIEPGMRANDVVKAWHEARTLNKPATPAREAPPAIVPMRPGTAHVIRLNGMSGQFTAHALPADPRGEGYGMKAVCSHPSCAFRQWRTRFDVEHNHGCQTGESHAWGWWHEGRLYAPAEAQPPKSLADDAPALPQNRHDRKREAKAASVFDDVVKVAEQQIQRLLLGDIRVDRCGCGKVLGDATSPHAPDCETVRGKASAVAPAEDRRAREAPLVALVNAVPEGLDANGWRAAVLAVDEANSRDQRREDRCRAAGTIHEDAIAWLIANKGRPCDLPTWTTRRKMHDAYARAIAPKGPRPAPERKGATWRERGPRIVVDHGED